MVQPIGQDLRARGPMTCNKKVCYRAWDPMTCNKKVCHNKDPSLPEGYKCLAYA
jgi:hypothetical protein